MSGGGEHDEQRLRSAPLRARAVRGLGRAARRDAQGARGRAQEPRHAHAVPGPRARGGAGPRPRRRSRRIVLLRRDRRRLHRLRDDLLHERDRLPDQRRATGRRTARRPTSRSPSSWRCCWAAPRRSSGSSRWPGLPKPYHPVFEVGGLPRASIDGFFLSVEVPEGGDVDKVAADVRGAGARRGRDRRRSRSDEVGAAMRLRCLALCRCAAAASAAACDETSSTRWPTASRASHALQGERLLRRRAVDARAARGHGPARAHHA